MKQEKIFKLKGKTTVFIDWANVYNWKKSLKREVDPKKLYKYLNSYKEIEKIRFYFGKDKHPKSKAFLKNMKAVGYEVVTKPVKYMFAAKIDEHEIQRRKCDFDMEICMDVHKVLKKNIQSFIFFTGDGDFAPLYKLLASEGKQVVVVYMYGHLGKEVFQIKKGVYKISIETVESKYNKKLTVKG